MKKKRVLLLVALILVVALSFGILAGCTPKSPIVVGGKNPTQNGKTVTLDDADSLQSVMISTNSPVADIYSYVTVSEVPSGKTVKVTIGSKGDNVYIINPPARGYALNNVYTIKLANGAEFVSDAFAGARTLTFTVTSNVLADVKMNENVVEYDSKLLLGDIIVDGTKPDGSVYGSFEMLTSGNAKLNPNDVIVLTDASTQSKEAFKVVEVTASAGVSTVKYEKPSIDEVYEEFKYSDNTKLDVDSDIDFIFEKDGGNALAESELATNIFTMFGQKPVFDVSASLIDNGVQAVVKITIPDVVKVEGFGTSSITISIVNDLTCDADTSVLLAAIKDGIKDAQFGITTNILNETTCKVTIDAGANYEKIENVQEIYEKLDKLANSGDESESSACLPLFKWVLPLAGGAINVSYDADLAFRFSFSGKFEIAAKGSLEYAVGVTYSAENGVDVVTENIKESGKFMDEIGMTVVGVATVKVGVIQRVGIDLLGGVLSAKVCAEIGNYNRLHGYAQSNNLLEKDKVVVGALYFEGGFYYDVDLVLAVKLGPLVLQDTKIDIAAGEIRLYEAGNRELPLAIVKKQSIELTAFKNTLADFELECYDLVTRAKYNRPIAASELTLKVANEDDFKIVDGNVIEVVNVDGFENVIMTVSYGKLASCDVAVSFNGAFYLETSNYSFDKADVDQIDVKIIKTANVTETAKVFNDGKEIESEYVVNSDTQATLKLSKRELSKLDSKLNNLTVVAGNMTADLKINVTGQVAWNQFQNAEVCDIFTADQIVSLVESGVDAKGLMISLSADIDMGGKVINPMANFEGTLYGNGYSISNYTINNIVDNKTGFIINNNGIIDNVEFAGNVNVEFEGAFKNDYFFGGVVAVNNGTMTNVKFTGKVNVVSNAIASFITYNIGAVVSVNNGTMTDCSSIGGDVAVLAKFALVNVTYNIGTLTAKTAGGASASFNSSFGVQNITKVNIVK